MAAKYFKKVDELLARALKNEPVTEDESTVSTKEPVARARAQSPLETKDEIKPPAPRIKKSKSAPPKLDIIQKMELGFPETTAAGKIKNTCENARHAIKLLGITCEYDEFHDKLIIGGQPIGQYAGELTDHACLYLRKMIEEQYDFDPLREKMFDACVQLALENRFDPIVDYLNAPTWDGVCRVGNWLSVYFGAKDTPLNRAIGKIALVAQVRRARQPGCKFDQIIVLESPEGWQKSTALSILAGGPIISLIRRFWAETTRNSRNYCAASGSTKSPISAISAKPKSNTSKRSPPAPVIAPGPLMVGRE